MIEINVYTNGYLIEGHASENVCDQVSMLGWQLNNLFSDLNIIKEYYYSSVPDKDSKEGLSFCRCDYSPFVEIFIDNFFDTVKYWLEKEYPKQIKVYDYRKENYGVGAHHRYFEPTEEYYKQCKKKEATK